MKECEEINRRKKLWLQEIKGLNEDKILDLRRRKQEEEGKDFECTNLTGHILGDIIAVLWDAQEGDWESAHHHFHRVLEKDATKLEECLCLPEGAHIYLRDRLEEMHEAIGEENLDRMASIVHSICFTLPYDTYEFLKGRCPFKKELCKLANKIIDCPDFEENVIAEESEFNDKIIGLGVVAGLIGLLFLLRKK